MFLKDEELSRRFDYHTPDSAGRQTAHENARDVVKTTAVRLNMMLPAGREAALAMTALEEALMWANAAIARQP